MKKYALNVDDRKELVGRLMELTGLSSQYTYMPRCACLVGNYTVEKEGTLVTDETADQQVIETLLAEGIIVDSDMPTPQPSVAEAEAPQDEEPGEKATAGGSSEAEEPNAEEEDDTPEESTEPENEDVDDLTVSVPIEKSSSMDAHSFVARNVAPLYAVGGRQHNSMDAVAEMQRTNIAAYALRLYWWKIQQTQVLQGFAAFRLTLSRIPPRHHQMILARYSHGKEG